MGEPSVEFRGRKTAIQVKADMRMPLICGYYMYDVIPLLCLPQMAVEESVLADAFECLLV